MILFKHDGVTVEAEAGYAGDTGERSFLYLHAYRLGPRGGKHTVWRGDVRDAEWFMELLRHVILHAGQVPERIEL